MAYRSNSSDVTPRQQRSQSSSMRSYGQDYSSMGGYSQRYSPVGNYSQSPAGRYSQDYGSNGGFIMGNSYPDQLSSRAYDARNSYYVNQMGRNAYDTRDSYFLNQMGRAAYGVPPRYRNERRGRNQASRDRKPVNGKRLPQRNPETEPPSKRPKVQDKTEEKNDQRKKRSFRARRPFRRQAKNLTERNLDGYEILKVPEDDAELKKEGIVDNQETTEVNGTEEKTKVKKFRACHVCKVASSHPELMIQHNNSEEHKSKIEAALAEKQEKKTAEGDKGKVQKKARSDNYCRLCEVTFTGSFLVHRKSSAHQLAKDKKYPKCEACSTGFRSVEEYNEHTKTDSHKQKLAEFRHSEKLPVGFDNDEAALEPVKVEDEKKEDDSKEVEEKEIEALGVSFVVDVKGFYCKLCRLYFEDGNVAKSKHCYSAMHYEAYKKTMAVVLKDNEGTQKIEEVHEAAGEDGHIEAKDAAKTEAESDKVTEASDMDAVPAEAKDTTTDVATEHETEDKEAATEAEADARDASKKETEPMDTATEAEIEMEIETRDASTEDKPAEAKQEEMGKTSLPEKKEEIEEMST